MLAAAALAVVPKSGKYAGHTSEPKLNGFFAPVTFKAGGTGLGGFKYSTYGCFGSGGRLTPGVNYYLKPWNVQKVGKVALSGRKFSVADVKSTYKGSNYSTVTTTSVSGKFTTAKKAKGTITFSQAETYSSHHISCGPASLTFTAKRK